LRFEVEDMGIGMNEGQLARLFHPFAQVAERKRREGGAGLGLAISRQLVRMMGGDIEVRSREGRGSVFSFEIEAPAPRASAGALPAGDPPIEGQGELAEQADGATDDAAVPHAGARWQDEEIRPDDRAVVSGARVLVVEDNAINRELMVTLLSAAGVVVCVAGDGQEALDRLGQQRFDVVLMDCLMPVMDGYAATRALRLRPELRTLPVIALTANAMVGDRQKALAAGMSDHIAKPVKIEELFATLARWVRPAADTVAEPVVAPGAGTRGGPRAELPGSARAGGAAGGTDSAAL
jgi:CheY-like chemotaxis protein